MKYVLKNISLFLFGLFFSVPVMAQEPEITGTVADDKGVPLPGVNILIKDAGKGTQTDFDGNFSIRASDGDILVFSYIGMKTVERKVAGQTHYNIILEPDSAELDEVVVVGYGNQKRSDVTSAIATMSTEGIDERPLAKVDQAMVGQMAGVRVKQTSGLPGQGFSVEIRGTGSISASNQPLYVIDGFPLEPSSQSGSGGFATGNPLSNINPNDIASMQVLKDAAAAAIYGSRASNGVVIITTKSGRQGKPRINFNTYFGINRTVKKLDVLSTEEWIERATEMIDYNWVHSGISGASASQSISERRDIYNNYQVAQGNPNAVLGAGEFNTDYMQDPRWYEPGYGNLDAIDWQDEIFRTGVVRSYQLSAQGATDNVKYYVSGEHLDQEGVAIGVDYKRYSARANVEVKASDQLKIGVNVAPSYSVSNDPGVEGKDRELHRAVSTAPLSADGLALNVGDNTPYAWGGSNVSPVAAAKNSLGEEKIFRTLSTLFVNYEVIEGLNIKSTLNFDNAESKSKYFKPASVSSNRQATGTFSSYQRQNFVNENTISYDKVFAEKHSLSALGGISYSTFKFDNQRIASADGFGTDLVPTLNGANNISASGTYTLETKKVLVSYFGRLQYNYDERYLLTASIRRDGSSNFGRSTQWGVFPSASVGWNMAKEKFMAPVDFIQNLKLRASWGLSGNNGFSDDYASIARLGISNYSYGGSLGSGLVPVNSPNPDLSWEESETINVGADIGIFNNRIFTSFDYYIKTNKDLLLNVPVPTASGFSNVVTNIGKIENRGWELELTTRNLVGDFQWTTNLNLTHNTNEVKQLGPDNSPILGGSFDIEHNILMVGQPMYSLYLVHQDGILTQEDIDSGAALYGNQTVGDPKYVDANGDGVISPDDRVLSGHPNPDYIWGITNNIEYKNFDLSVLLQGQWGGKIYSNYGRAIDRTGMGYNENVLGTHRDRWRSPENPGNGEDGKANSNFGRIKNTNWLYPSDYWRIRNITLGYNVSPDLLKSNFIKGFRIYVSLENWFGGDKYVGGFNPEAVNNDGDDYGAFPLSKSIVTGLNFTF
ncbi:SusC/RagA family TonB-linked outer membrane protein [Sinomicrobium soli]|uniref:SusC/RagA family TonB-linked outer membrane protein n=1 Tax=Sinomicrobium sp. N-1-3-6 TaxID=2219864 RepID=UPI000DCCDEB1|nr:TonB-dependent receptor [Sinomicrobium sp. N-1-3-6]RAV28506.1 TonB-dependent receptor [Sinomicrobium sp. N-1-3-6]